MRYPGNIVTGACEPLITVVKEKERKLEPAFLEELQQWHSLS